MRAYDEIDKDARDGSPFSNSTSGEMWMSRWCHRCANDSPEMVDRGEGCPLILVALCGRTPVEWLEQEGIQDYHCIEFRPEDDGGGDDKQKPPPQPMPGQVELFPSTDTHQGVRMFKDVVDEVRQVTVS